MTSQTRMARIMNTNLMILVIVGTVLFSSANNNAVVGQCQGDMPGLITQCGIYVQKFTPKMTPSAECCSVIKDVDVPCMCEHLTKEMLLFVDMQKVFYVTQECGKPIPSGTNCAGSTMHDQMLDVEIGNEEEVGLYRESGKSSIDHGLRRRWILSILAPNQVCAELSKQQSSQLASTVQVWLGDAICDSVFKCFLKQENDEGKGSLIDVLKAKNPSHSGTRASRNKAIGKQNES
ncbi:hypothetical protein VNO77_26880 [Canavalia gladiata]|uniref:Bifunctional inhibitor/plant lipid transfer protein/seed storage helical domain-containing protein n=1 Tax=Canavalia gladiata TaxID=3824 RepID=A0AAN9KXV1_CANGL